jgi:hypothetical protein
MSHNGLFALVWESGRTLVVSLTSGASIAAIGEPQRAEVWPAAPLTTEGDFMFVLNDSWTGKRSLAVFHISTRKTTIVESGNWISASLKNLAVHPSGKSFVHGYLNGMRGESEGVD